MTARVIIYCVLGGIPLLVGALGMGHWTIWWLAGFVLALAFAPVALFGARGTLAQFAVIAPALLIVTALCTWSEALIFVSAPQFEEHRFQALIGSCVMYLIFAGVLAVLAKLLKLNRQSTADVSHRGVTSSIFLVLLCGIAYILYYLFFGAITYEFFTKGFYPEATKVVEKLGLWFWAIQFTRGVLMTLAVIPILYTLRMRRWQAAIVAGLIIWIAGGLAPLLLPNPFMTFSQRMIHVVEIFTQNFSLGVTAALLLRRSASSMQVVQGAAAA
jgi:hypothetical protein